MGQDSHQPLSPYILCISTIATPRCFIPYPLSHVPPFPSSNTQHCPSVTRAPATAIQVMHSSHNVEMADEMIYFVLLWHWRWRIECKTRDTETTSLINDGTEHFRVRHLGYIGILQFASAGLSISACTLPFYHRYDKQASKQVSRQAAHARLRIRSIYPDRKIDGSLQFRRSLHTPPLHRPSPHHLIAREQA